MPTWVRTGPALVAGVVAVASCVPGPGVSWSGGAVGLALVATGLGTALAGYRRRRRTERAMTADGPLPGGPEVPALRTLVAVVVLLVAVLLVAEAAAR
jgi:inner membrane protein YidH